jgi:hypothetical protein
VSQGLQLPDGSTQCSACHQVFRDAPGETLHENVCPKFTCASCGARFALFPEPLKKRFGSKPKCRGCVERDAVAVPQLSGSRTA